MAPPIASASTEEDTLLLHPVEGPRRTHSPRRFSPTKYASTGSSSDQELASMAMAVGEVAPAASPRHMTDNSSDFDSEYGGVDVADALENGERRKLVVALRSTDRRTGNSGNGNGTPSNGKPKRTALSPSSLSARDSTPPSTRRSVASRRSSTREKISVLAVVVHLCKGNIGPGAMSLPNGFSKTGIYAAPVYFVIVALVSTYNMDLLLYCKRMVSPNRAMSFGDVAGKILGRRGKLLVDVFLVGTQLGICCVYFTFIATNIHVVLPEEMQLVIHERQLIFAIFPVILLLSWIRTLHRITPYSSLANAAVVLGISIVFYYSIDYFNHPTKPRVAPVTIDVARFPEFYGTAVYSFEGIGLILPIQNEMQHPHLFPRVLVSCMLVILVLFLFIGELPALAFGQITNGSMTAVLHEYCDGWLVTAANVMLAFACLLSFPIQFYPAVDVLERAMTKHRGENGSSHSSSSLRPRASGTRRGGRDDALTLAASQRRRASASMTRSLAVSAAVSSSSASPSRVGNRSRRSAVGPADAMATGPPAPSTGLPRWLESLMCSMSQYECNRTIFRSMLCTALMVVAVCIPDVGLLISLFGAVGSSMLAIIVPPVLYLQLHRRRHEWHGELDHELPSQELLTSTKPLSRISRILHSSIIVFGVLGMVAGTVQAIRDIIASFAAP